MGNADLVIAIKSNCDYNFFIDDLYIIYKNKMVIFYFAEENAVFGVPFKCGYSTMSHFVRQKRMVVFAHELETLKDICNNKTRFYCFVRDPKKG